MNLRFISGSLAVETACPNRDQDFLFRHSRKQRVNPYSVPKTAAEEFCTVANAYPRAHFFLATRHSPLVTDSGVNLHQTGPKRAAEQLRTSFRNTLRAVLATRHSSLATNFHPPCPTLRSLGQSGPDLCGEISPCDLHQAPVISLCTRSYLQAKQTLNPELIIL